MEPWHFSHGEVDTAAIWLARGAGFNGAMAF